MAIKLKKEDFDKHNVKGFKIGDKVLIHSINLSSEIIAIDKDPTSNYNVMIDDVGIEDYSVPELSRCRLSSVVDFSTIYYRKKALKNKYDAWVRSTDLEHIPTEEKDWQEIESTKSEENDMEDDDIEETEEHDDSDTFMIEDYLKDDYNPHYSEFYLKPKYNGSVSGSSDWGNETYTDKDSLIEVNYDEAEYVAIVFDPDNSSSKEKLLEALIESSEKMSNVYTLNTIIMNDIALANNDTPVKDLIQDILHDTYVEDIIRSYRWNNRGMCAVLVALRK